MKKIAGIFILSIIIIAFSNIITFAKEDFNIDLNLSEIEQKISDDGVGICYYDLLEYVKNGSYKQLFNIFKSVSLNKIYKLLVNNKKIMLRLFSLCLLSVIVNMFSDDNYRLCDRVLLLFTLGSLIEIYGQMYALCIKTVNSILDFTKVSLPVYFSITTIIHDKLPLSVYSVFMIFIYTFQWLSVNLIFPLQTFSLLCTVLGGIYNGFDFKYIKKQVITVVRVILGIYTTFFILGLKITQVISYSSQKVIITGVQYALSKGVPVIGGFLSETAETLFASIVLIHNSVGVSSVLVVLLIAFAPFFIVFTVSLIIKFFCSFFISLNCNKLIETVYGFGECLCELSVILLCCSVTFIIGFSIELISVR